MANEIEQTPTVESRVTEDSETGQDIPLLEKWPELEPEERLKHFLALNAEQREELFLALDARDQVQIVLMLPLSDWRYWLRLLPPDDAADFLQETTPEQREHFFLLLDKVTRREVSALLAYAEDEAGGLMSPRYARLRPDMSVDEAITYLRRQARRPIETLSYFYVLDQDQFLLGVISFRDLFLQPGFKLISEIMYTDVVSVSENTNQEEINKLLRQHNLVAIPVVDGEGRLKGIVTIDDVMDAIQEEVTEDIQKIGGSEALDEPYLEVSFWKMLRKRAGWLAVLLVGEMFTANAMAQYEHELAKAVVLALFIPLVISSGGNSGSQASTLVVRAIALGQVRSSLWWRVLRRELAAGLSLGIILGMMGMLRIYLWPNTLSIYGDHYWPIALTVAFSLVGVVLWGTVAGSMLPLLLKRLGFDPASASAPFVATIVDVTGLIIYFTMAEILLRGTLL